MLMYAWSERLEFNELIDMVTDNCISRSASGRPNYPVDKLLIESKGSGISVAHELHRMWKGSGKLGIELIDPKKYGDKVARVQSIQHLFSDGMIYAPNKPWADKVIRQCSVFPKGSNDDLVDTTSQALRWLRDNGFALRRDEAAIAAAEELSYDNRTSIRPLYEV
jgi:predicted phage terminase large subunit-like protein